MSSAAIKRIDPREHVLLRPDMYIGSITPETARQWMVNPEGKLFVSNLQMVPGLYKIFDEIITNASDNKQRDKDRSSSHKMTYIKVSFDKTPKGTMITVTNDGLQGFIDFNKEENMYIPQLAFGILMTSSNYDDTEERVTGGRNGFGAKLTNIYSKLFKVEAHESGRQYVQEWRDNMAKCTEPQITKEVSRKHELSVSFIPDYAKFQMTDLSDDMKALLTRRVYDVAGCAENLSVTVDGVEIPVKSFHQYVQQVFMAASPEAVAQNAAMNFAAESVVIDETTATTEPAKKTTKSKKHWTDEFVAYYEPNEFWSVAVFGNEAREYQQISFVNSLFTSEGGSHVETVIDNLLAPINAKVQDHLKKLEIKSAKELTRAQIKNNIFIIVKALVVNPQFDSQTKTNLRTSKTQFKKTLTFDAAEKNTKEFFKTLGANQTLMTNLAQLISTQQNKALTKTDGTKTRNIIVPKLDDAIDAGTGNAQRCSLFLTEGDSAKGLVVEGLSKMVDGRKYNGVFPLRGKVLNVREATHDKVGSNIEITNIKKILGLKQGVDYTDPDNRKQLRYGKVVIMADQDTDGSHIKGLLLNLFDTYWSGLLKAGFVQEFITPIVRVKRNGSRQVDVLDFYTIPEFQLWLSEHPNTKDFTISYYKGLGTSDNAEAKEYFKQIGKNKKQFTYDATSSQRLNLAFNKKLADQRKLWLRAADPSAYLDNKQQSIQISQFVDKELIYYELENVRRSIPSMVDGMKPSQRKILFACFKRKLTQPLKVSQLAGYVSEHASYHHGETSLQGAIVNLAQCFTGANNIPLLVPKGQFGSRPRGGEDSAAARYITTMLQPITRYIFREEDDQVLNYQNDDGQLIEPDYYVPIIPLTLVNGATGIGTGWSTSVPQFNPSDIIDGIIKRLLGKSTKSERYGAQQLQPWYRGWTGNVKVEYRDAMRQYVEKWIFQGTFESRDDKTFVITELPPGIWTEEYRDKLNAWMLEDKSKETGTKRPDLVAVNDLGDNNRVEIHVTLDKSSKNLLEGNVDTVGSADYNRIMTLFNLEGSVRQSNMNLHDAENVLQQYKSASHIIDAFLKVRLTTYEKRKEAMLDEYREQMIIASEKARFIKLIVDGLLKVQNVPLAELCANLWKQKFMPARHNRLVLLGGYVEAVADQETSQQLDNADQKQAEEALKKKIKDVPERDQFFAKIAKQPESQVLNQIYQFLTRLAIQSLTRERYQELIREQEAAEQKYEELVKTTLQDMYLRDLAALRLALTQFEQNLQNDATGKAINISKQDIEQEVKAILRKGGALPDKTGESDVEPELIPVEKKKVEKSEGRPALLSRGAAAPKPVKKEDGDEKPKATRKPKAESEGDKPKRAPRKPKDEGEEKPKRAAKPKEDTESKPKKDSKPKDDEEKPKKSRKVEVDETESESDVMGMLYSDEDEGGDALDYSLEGDDTASMGGDDDDL